MAETGLPHTGAGRRDVGVAVELPLGVLAAPEDEGGAPSNIFLDRRPLVGGAGEADCGAAADDGPSGVFVDGRDAGRGATLTTPCPPRPDN